ncbi:heavy metal-responsive transcriptional regulator [Xanthomonas euvesicatoria pv. allii]|uniref:heavy metal-responsive transcriptional regulator n=1 Tax=Xanthomonas euvesicatoria TaxID=456327 RepID=UPI002405BD3D|nr:heavy metal-responsive transcriptional regulator [Xanthomonas euvesicatoria]MCP3050696.1 heavy metal-responsive transcriptional regulator [Xanthomonas euvesicatoria pv. allii]
MKIGELAKRSDIGIDAIRFYEREGLLPPAQRLASGYRVYDDRDLQRLQFVRRAKALGFTLPEIVELLALSTHAGDDMATMKATAQQKLADIDAKLADLTRIRDGLSDLVAACPGHGALHRCPILNALAEEPV